MKLALVSSLTILWVVAAAAETAPTLQEQLDQHPGQPLHLPPGEYRLQQPLRFQEDGGGLTGAGVLLLENPAVPAIQAEGARRLRFSGFTITRTTGPADAPALLLIDCEDVTVEGVGVYENQARGGAIEIRGCRWVSVRGATVWNYKRLAVDDRTDSPHYGYAFKCIDGHGILASDSANLQVIANRVVEERWLPTRAAMEEHGLGQLTEGRHPAFRGTLAGDTLERGGVTNWHQGSAILVTGPRTSRNIQIAENQIQNCAQGIDLHADLVTVSNNSIDHGMIGIKATHGSQHLIVSGNRLHAIDLWGILMNPGTGSDTLPGDGDESESTASNVDGGAVISGNLITAFGTGHEYWNWGGRSADAGSSYGIALLRGQLPENYPVHDVLITGNMLYDPEKGVEKQEAANIPRHRFAVFMDARPEGDAHSSAPIRVRLENNHFDPGREGVSNFATE